MTTKTTRTTKGLLIQLHLDRLPKGSDAMEFVLGLADPSLQIVSRRRGDDDGAYVNAIYATDDLLAAWARIRPLLAQAGMDVGALVTCQGDRGWDDARLLHSFDPAEKTEQPPP